MSQSLLMRPTYDIPEQKDLVGVNSESRLSEGR